MPVTVSGLDELSRELRKVDPRLNKQLQRANKDISTDLANKSQAAVSGLTDAGGRGARGIRPRAGAKKATIALLGSNAFVRAAVFGAEVHWVFGRPMAAADMSRRAWQPWIGDDWTPEEGLYGISPVIKSAIPDILDTYGDRVMDALAGAFPQGG
jgi:hypothetical protein